MKTIQTLAKLLFFIFLMINQMQAQTPSVDRFSYDIRKKNTILDSATYSFRYELKFITDTVKNDTLSNQFYLLIGDNYSKFFDAVYLNKNFIDLYKKYPLNLTPNKDNQGLAATEIYKNKIDNNLTVTVMVMQIPYIYENKLETQKWTITSDKKKILEYNCQKATTDFLGRKYEAWFAADIPIQNGPWKFGGLPGLILQVYDKTGQYTFNCVGIEKLTQKIPIVQYSAQYKKTDRISLNKIIKNLHLHFIQVLQGMLDSNSSFMFNIPGYDKPISISHGESSINDLVFPYNPIELE